MYSDIGKKIKRYVLVVSKVSIGLFIGASIIGIFSSDFSGENDTSALLNIVTWIFIGVLGSIGSWLGGFVLYGFGELIDKVCDIEKHLRNGKNPQKEKSTIINSEAIGDRSNSKKTYKYNTRDWVCPNCGTTNIYYYEKCECGALKPEN